MENILKAMIVADASALEETLDQGVDSGVCSMGRGILLPEDLEPMQD